MTFEFNPFTKKLDIVSAGVSSNWGTIGGTLSDQTDLQLALDNKADLVHTHISSDITDFQTSVSANTDVSNNTLLAHTRNQDEQLRGGLVDVDASGNTVITGELGFKVYIQPTEPVLTANKRMALWEDTTSGFTFLVYKSSIGVQKLVEMA